MKVYHATTPQAAAVILGLGFLDGTESESVGVCIADRPVGESGAETFLEITLDDHAVNRLKYFEWAAEEQEEEEWLSSGPEYREWLVPARLLNTHGTVRIYEEA